MHAAPSVRMILVPDRAWRVGVTLLVCAASASLTAWVVSHGQVANVYTAIAALAVAAGSGAAAWLHLRRRGAMNLVLTWDGATWHWAQGAAAPCAGEVHVMVDLGVWLLLRCTPAMATQGVAWQAVSRGAAGPLWPAWRAALYARRPTSEPASTPGAI